MCQYSLTGLLLCDPREEIYPGARRLDSLLLPNSLDPPSVVGLYTEEPYNYLTWEIKNQTLG